jgi:hypothetical protein
LSSEQALAEGEAALGLFEVYKGARHAAQATPVQSRGCRRVKIFRAVGVAGETVAWLRKG